MRRSQVPSSLLYLPVDDEWRAYTNQLLLKGHGRVRSHLLLLLPYPMQVKNLNTNNLTTHTHLDPFHYCRRSGEKMVTEQIQGSVRAVGRAFTVATSSATIRNAGAKLLD